MNIDKEIVRKLIKEVEEEKYIMKKLSDINLFMSINHDLYPHKPVDGEVGMMLGRRIIIK